MKIGIRSTYYPRLGVGVKKALLNLNNDLDSIKSAVQFNSDYGFYFGHSINPSSEFLTKLEILTLFLEDRRFFLHHGFEFRSGPRLVRRFLLRGRIGGVSTIDQQVVRIITRRNERTLRRKVKEIALAFFCNFHLPKKELLDYYLHNAYLGYRMEGCEVASQKIFGISASDLNWEQSALIASLYPLPFPKQAWEVYSSDSRYPTADPSILLAIVEESTKRWCGRVKYRMHHAVSHQDFKPRSL